MKRKGLLWFFILLIIVFIGTTSVKWTIPVTLTENSGESVQIITDDNISIVEKDFRNFCNIATDFINVVFKGEESKYEASGLELLLGGTDELSESVNKSENEAIPATGAENLTACEILHISDGDTFTANINNTETKIRLIGIDTPESVHVDETKNTEWGEYASAHTKEILAIGQEVYLEYDVDKTDQYGRTLAYVWLTNDTSDITNMLNAKILADGYAMDKVYPPNEKYAENFEQIRMEAQQNSNGLWGNEGFQALWEDAV